MPPVICSVEILIHFEPVSCGYSHTAPREGDGWQVRAFLTALSVRSDISELEGLDLSDAREFALPFEIGRQKVRPPPMLRAPRQQIGDDGSDREKSKLLQPRNSQDATLLPRFIPAGSPDLGGAG
jgi:hypothetical protein